MCWLPTLCLFERSHQAPTKLSSCGCPVQEARRHLTPFVDSRSGSVTAALAQRLPQAAQTSVRHNYALALLVVASIAGNRAAAANMAIPQTCATANSLLEGEPDSQDAALLAAGAAGLLRSSDQGIRVVEAWVQAHPGVDATRAVLMGAHIACSTQPPKLEAALELLGHPRLSANVSHAPAVLATRACVRDRLALPQADDEAQTELIAAIDWWTSQAVGSERSLALAACYQQQAALLLRNGKLQAALESLRALKVCICNLLPCAAYLPHQVTSSIQAA